MAKAYVMDFAAATAEQYDAVIEDMRLDGHLPPGAAFHYAGPTDSGWRVVDCWDDPDAFDRFAAEQIGPLTARHGIERPAVRVLDVAQQRHGTPRRAEVLQVVYLPGLDRMGFLAADRRVLPDGRIPDGIVHHVNGVYEDGSYVIDSWETRAAYERFREERIVPNVDPDVLSGPPVFELMPVHNMLYEPAVVRT